MEMVVKYQDAEGKARVCGGKDLKKSQAYPQQCLGQILVIGFAFARACLLLVGWPEPNGFIL